MPNIARKTPTRSTDEKRLKQPHTRAPQIEAPQSQAAELSRAVENPAIATPANLVSLQRRYGNRAVQRLTQPKPAHAPAADTETYEQEAEPVGEEVLAPAPLASLPRPFGDDEGQPNSTGVVQRLPRLGGERVQREGEVTAPTQEEVVLPTTNGQAEPPTNQPTQNNTTVSLDTTTQTDNTTQPHTTTQTDNTVNTAPTTTPTTTPGTNGAGHGTTTETTPTGPATWLEMQSLAHEEKIRPILKSYMASQNFDRNYDFYFDTSDSQSLYKKYILQGAPKQINVEPATRGNLDELAQSKKWRAMGRPMDSARAENQEIINTKVLPGFEQSDAFQKFTDKRRPEPGGSSRVGAAFSGMKETVTNMRQMAARPAWARQQQLTKATMARLEKLIADYSPYFENGKTTVAELGVPQDSKAVEKMFQVGRNRHRNVVAIFTQRASRDKFFRKTLYPAFFTKLQNFTRLWTEYRKLLGR